MDYEPISVLDSPGPDHESSFCCLRNITPTSFTSLQKLRVSPLAGRAGSLALFLSVLHIFMTYHRTWKTARGAEI
jgi:hypothetical protein